MSDNSHVRKSLLSKYDPFDTGMWRILGEDPNCDFAGSHHQPELGTVTGTYHKVVEYALSMPQFFTWGGGGTIIKMTSSINVDDIDPAKVAALKAEHAKLTARSKEIEDELAKMTGTK